MERDTMGGNGGEKWLVETGWKENVRKVGNYIRTKMPVKRKGAIFRGVALLPRW